MFEIDVTELLSSYEGDSREYSLTDIVPNDVYEDIDFLKNIELDIALFRTEKGIDCMFKRLSTEVVVDDERHAVELHGVLREFHTKLADETPDDIRKIEDFTIDLTPVIREEILIEIGF